MSCIVNVSINRNNIIDVNIGEYVVIFEDAEEYDGEYVVTPKINEEIVLETANKNMTENVTVKKVPFHEMQNESGGTTVYIGMEVE